MPAYEKIAYGLSDALLKVPMLPVVGNRAPTYKDKNFDLGTIWVYDAQNLAYVLTSVVNNEANWEVIVQGEADFVVETLQTVDNTPGLITTITLADTSSINLSGSLLGSSADFTDSLRASFSGGFYRSGGGATSIGASTFSSSTTPGSGASAIFSLQGNDVRIAVLGQAATVWNWKVEYTQISLT